MKLKVIAPKGFSRYVKNGEVIEVEERDPENGKMVKRDHEREVRQEFTFGQIVEVDGESVTADDAAAWQRNGVAEEVSE